MKDQDNVCRVCSAQDGILLDLFGPQPQSRSYAADVIKCLSVEVCQGDGLPGKICIKCVGLLSDCRPFVEKVLELTGNGKERSVSVEECFFCLSSENCLFPIPALSVSKTKNCFGIDVLATRQICHKCQFHLESIHELKEKALATLKTHSKEPMSPKRGRKPSSTKAKPLQMPRAKKTVFENEDNISQSNCEKRESVNDMVNKLRQTYKMGEDESRSVKVRIVDIKLIIGPDFLSKGTINVTEFFQKLNPSSTPIVDVVSRRGRKKSNLLTVQENPLKSPVSISKPVSVSKSQLPTSQNQSRIKKRSRESETDVGWPSKKSHVEKDADESHMSESDFAVDSLADEGKKSPKRRKRGLSSDSSLKCGDPENEREEPSSNREGDESVHESNENDGPEEERAENYDNSVPSSRLNSEKEDVKHPGQNDESLDEGKENEGQSKQKRKKRKGNSTNFSKYFDDEDKPQPIIRRKRKDSEDEHNGFKGFKGRKRRWEPSQSGEDQAVEEPSTADNVENVEQPEFLKELDELLKFTPKSKFRPFICSVCHEGYVSTVKGKLHKLIVHDPQFKKMSLTLRRCDDSPEMEEWRERVERERLEKQTLPQEITCDGSDKESIGYIIDDDDDAFDKEDEQSNDKNKLKEDKESREDSKSKEDDKSKENGLDSDDELFARTTEVKRIETTNAFEELLKGTSVNDKEDKETIHSSASDKAVDEANSSPKNLAGSDMEDMDKDEKESKDKLPNDVSNTGDEKTEIILECNMDSPEVMSKAEKTCDISEGGIENEADEKAGDAEEKTFDTEEKTNDAEEKTNDAEEKTNDAEEKTNDVDEKTNNAGEKTNDAEEKNDVRVEDPSTDADSQGEESTNIVEDQEKGNNSETEEQGADNSVGKDMEVGETVTKPLENKTWGSNDANDSISHENKVDGATEEVSVEVDGLPIGNNNKSQETVDSDEDRHADVESNGDSGERSEVKGCSEELLESEVQPDLCEDALCAQEPHTNAAGIIVSN